MMRAKTRVVRALAVAGVAVSAVLGAIPAAVGSAAVASERQPEPVTTWYGTASYGWTTSHGWTLWSSSCESAPSRSDPTVPNDAMDNLRARLDQMRATLGQRLRSDLADVMSTPGTSLPPGVTLPDPADPADHGVGAPSVRLPNQPPLSTQPPTMPASTQPPGRPAEAVSTAKLELRRTAVPAQAKPGDTVTHTVTVSNSGGGEAKSAVVRNSLPAGAKLVDSKPSQGEFDAATGVWKTGRIKADSEVILILVLKVPQGAAGSEMTARSSFVSAPGAKPVIRNACGDDAEATCASTRVADSTTR
ncbi:DUF11 domain-containing protein [Embleya sp. NPDC005575]|uniref:DUF11 domain-containing protein n=1 Tax=Embleya sp. NPDC005575 TaxID=3156892 RepID=UPI0033B84D7E